MPSDLYRSAVASLLEEERETLTILEAWLQDLQEISGDPGRGDCILKNLQSESHLLGDGPWGHVAELAEFLRQCGREHAQGVTEKERQLGYKDSCASFEGKGFKIEQENLPGTLLRYSRNAPLVLELIEPFLPDRAKQDALYDPLSLEDAFTWLSSASWNPSLIEDGLLLGGKEAKMVFATFEHPVGAPRNHAGNMAAALALPRRPRIEEEILVEFSYSTDSVSNYRFPTVADAGWIQEFQPAPELEPDPARRETCCGWTRPLGPWPPQPELVHENKSLRILDGPPRFVGRYNS
ncbi:MAG TPA: hypothetical protein VGS07_32805 [Thermoanaerobaculia bacterium]|jgi:hypothetical protein|nr:hypothetical protein [Thermoanaerobaculia bacterium]